MSDSLQISNKGGIVTENKYFLFSDEIAFQNGQVRNAEFKESGVFLSESGIWAAFALDSAETDTKWDNVEIDFKCSENSFFRFTAFAMNKTTVKMADEEVSLSDNISKFYDSANKFTVLDEINAISYVNCHKAPLSSLRGKYLWIIVEAFPETGTSVEINRIKVTYPLNSYIEALPEIFRKNDNGNLTALLGMYKAVFDELDNKLVAIDDEFDIEKANGESFERLISWQGIEISPIWGEDKLRLVLKNSAELVRMKGTKFALSKLFTILLDKPPIIKERTNNSIFDVSVIIDYNSVPSGRHHAELIKLMKEFTPAGVNSRLILTRNGTALDNSYLGNDTVLNDNTAVIIDDKAVLSDNSFDSGLII